MTLPEQTTLANGLQITFYDHSRILAGDRWRVELCCEAIYPLRGEFPAPLPEEADPGLRAAILERLGDRLRFEVRRTRNFVDQSEKDGVLAHLLSSINEHMLTYCAKPSFPARLFQDNWQRLRDECRHEIRCRQAIVADDDREEDGPADFSALFKS